MASPRQEPGRRPGRAAGRPRQDWLAETGYYDEDGTFFGGDPDPPGPVPLPRLTPEEVDARTRAWLTKVMVCAFLVAVVVGVVGAAIFPPAVQAAITAAAAPIGALTGAVFAYFYR